MKKKLTVISVVIIICICALAGCKKDVGTPEDNAVKEEDQDGENMQEQGYLFGFSGIDMENPYFVTLESATRETVEKEGNRMITKDPSTDAEIQAAQIQEMINEGIAAIFLCPVDWDKITPSLEALKKADIKIINIDTQVKDMSYVDAYIGSNNEEAGTICGEDLIEKCSEGGKVAILECTTQNSINDRITGFEQAIAKAEKGFEVVARGNTDGSFDKGLESMKNILQEHPDLTAIMCGNDQLAVAAKTAVNLAERPDVIIFGVDGSPDIKKELKKPESQIAGTAAQSPINMGKTAAKTAISMLDGDDYEKEVFEEVFMITAENVDMYGVDGWQ